MNNISPTSNKELRVPRILLLPAIIAILILGIAFLLAGCTSATRSENASAPSAEAPVVEEAPVDDGIAAFGEVFDYADGVSISVSEGVAFQPTDTNAGAVDGQTHLAFTIVLTNNTSDTIDPYTYETVSSGGAEASSIFDMDNPIGDVGGSPMTSLLPGKSVSWIVGYSVADPADIVFEVAPGFEYDEVIFTNAQ